MEVGTARTVARYDEDAEVGGTAAGPDWPSVQGSAIRGPGEPAEEDSVFRRLLGEAGWARLHPEVRRRFGVEAEATQHYAGFMSEVRLSRLGWLLAQVCRLIGTPLAPWRGRDVPVLARVYREARRVGTTWERFYCYPARRPVRVASTKVCDRAAGLMEVVAGGLGMYLRLFEREGALFFESRGYFWEVLGRRLPLPGFLTPGRTLVSHAEAGGGYFRFTLEMRHPVFGETVFQTGLFREMGPAG